MQNKLQAVEALEQSTRQSPYRHGSRLPPEVQEVVAGHLWAGLSISETARRAGVSRDRVRTIKYALFGLTLADVRRFKRGLRV